MFNISYRRKTAEQKLLFLFHFMANLLILGKLTRFGVFTGVEDAAQSFGANYKGKSLVTFQPSAAYCFPTKPLGCYGDGGAFYLDEDLAQKIRQIARHGQSKDTIIRVGINIGLDTMQAAILLQIECINYEINQRNILAARYSNF